MLKILLLSSSLLVINPLGVSWDKKYTNYPQINDYKYYYGSILWGQVVYLGKEDILGMESEIHLLFNKKNISKAVLILGPTGINEWNCLSKYIKVRKILIHKYGKFNFVKETKDPVIKDLLTSSACHPISIGLREIETHWETKNYRIKLSLIGEDGEFFIEIDYIHKNNNLHRLREQKDKIIKKF